MRLISLIKVTVFGRELPWSPAATPTHWPASAPKHPAFPKWTSFSKWTVYALICNQSFHLYFYALDPSPSGMSSLADVIPSLSCLVHFSVPAGPPLFLHLKKHSLDPAFLPDCPCISLLLFAAKLLKEFCLFLRFLSSCPPWNTLASGVWPVTLPKLPWLGHW